MSNPLMSKWMYSKVLSSNTDSMSLERTINK